MDTPELSLFFKGDYTIYSKYWDTLSTYHSCPKIWKGPFYSLSV